MAIRLRLALLFAAGAALLLAAGGAVFVHELSAGLRGSLQATLRTQANALVQSLPDGGNFQDPGPGTAPPGNSGASDLGRASKSSDALSQVVSATGRIFNPSGPAATRPLLSAAQLARARRSELYVQSAPSGESSFLLLARPLDSPRGSVVVVGASLDLLDESVRRVVAALAVGGPLAVVLAGLGAWLLAGAALAPVERMRLQAAEISAKDRNATLVVPRTKDEVASLAHTLNSLLGRLQEALSRQRGFVASAGHELRTPLAILRAELELANRRGRSREELAAAVASAGEETERLVRLAEDLLVLARSDEGAPLLRLDVQDVTAIVVRSMDAYRQRARRAQVDLRLQGADHLAACVDETRIRQVVDNLVDNALRFSPAGSTVELTLGDNGANVTLEVGDRGPGFAPEFLPHAFGRFQRSDDERSRDHHGGAGLGLSIVQALVEAHGGRVSAANRIGGGALLRVILPAGVLPAAMARPAAWPRSLHRGAVRRRARS